MKGKFENNEKPIKRIARALWNALPECGVMLLGICVAELLGLTEWLDTDPGGEGFLFLGVIVILILGGAFTAIVRLIRKKKKSCDTEQEETTI